MTRVLVSHQTQYLPLADHVIIVDGGHVIAQGTYKQLVECGADLSCIGNLAERTEEEEEEEEEEGAAVEAAVEAA
eukprot:6108818-Prymnesium_polylepis.1